jgi:hypothetical protein
MLHQEDLSQTTTPSSAPAPAAQVRVSAEELARAVARYQARRDEAAKRLEGTLTLGEAIQELGLDVTPEELLSEVQAERVTYKASKKPNKFRLRMAGAGIGMLLLLGSGLWLTLRPVPMSLPGTMIWSPSQPMFLPVTAYDSTLVQDNNGPKPVLRTLGEISDNRPVHTALEQTQAECQFTGFSTTGTAWTLVKHGGRVYIRAWMASMSPMAISTSPVSLYRDKSLVPSGTTAELVTLPLNDIKRRNLQGTDIIVTDDRIVGLSVRPDSHFNEASQTTQK